MVKLSVSSTEWTILKMDFDCVGLDFRLGNTDFQEIGFNLC